MPANTTLPSNQGGGNHVVSIEPQQVTVRPEYDSMSTDLLELWRQREEAAANYLNFENECPEEDAAYARFNELDERLRAARPTDLQGLALQVRSVLDRPELDGNEDVLEYVVDQLERLARARWRDEEGEQR